MSADSLTAAIPHLLRPIWMLALLALPLLWWLQYLRARNDTPWKRAVDPHLLPSLLQAAPASTQRSAWLFGAIYALLVLALAGPAWRQQPVPLYAPVAPLVVVLDLSSHMLVADLQPTRLLRARLKIEQLVTQRRGGQIGLIAYAGDAFTVAPLSDDANSLRDLLAALTPDTMPVDGQRADRGIQRAVDLLAQAGFAHGQILLLSDGADAAAQAAAHAAAAKGYTVDALGIGTAAGAPLPSTDGTFAQEIGGVMQVARLDADALRALARVGDGRYAALDANTDDLAALGVLDGQMDAATQRGDTDSLRWRDDGPFLLLALLPLVALGFRRGWLAVTLLAVFVMPIPRAEAGEASWWNGLWQRADQRADHALRAGDAVSASALAQTPEQRAAAAYRSGDYANAAHAWTTLDSADAHYNRGNALAQMKRYPAAITAYERALQLRPDMTDAKANLELVRQLQKRQQANRQQQDQQQKDHQPTQHGQDQAQSNQQHDSAQQNQQQQSQQQQSQQQQGQQGQNQQQQSQQQQMSQQQQNQAQQRRSVQQQQQHDQQQQSAPDRNKQAQADAAERRALDQAMHGSKSADRTALRAKVPANETSAQRERREAIEALLQRVPDDPGGLLRRKFALEYARRQQEGER